MNQRENNNNEMKLSETKILPNLRKALSASKNLITLSKVQIDKNMITIEQPLNKNTRQVVSSFNHKRIISSTGARQFIHSQMSKTYRNFYDSTLQKNKLDNIGKQKSSSISNLTSNSQRKPDKMQKIPQAPKVQKAKISTKQIGFIKAYSVNSHPGILNTINEDRICVITNLNKSIQRDSQISFFSIYDGANGVRKAEYFRDHFHQILTRDKDFYKDIEMSVKKAIMIIENDYQKANFQTQKMSTTTFLMAIIINGQIYIASMGQNRMVISYCFGQQICNPLKMQAKKKPSLNTKMIGNLTQPKIMLNIIKVDAKQCDFIILGSEGLFENFDEKYLGKRVWKEIICKNVGNIHLMLGETSNIIMNQVFQQISTKNVSIILIVFQNLQKCLIEDECIDLPYVTANKFQQKFEI